MFGNIKGEVTYILRDAATEEIIEEHTQENIITEYFWSKLQQTWQCGFNIVVTSAVMEPSRYTYLFPGSGTAGVSTTLPSSNIPAVGVRTVFYPKSGSTAPYIQLAGRYSAPTLGTTRTINSVGLGAFNSTYVGTPNSSPSLSDNSQLTTSYSSTRPNAMAFLKLTSPCIQTDTQVLDVYYRVFFTYPASGAQIPEWMYNSRFVQNDWNSANYGGFPGNTILFPFPLPKPKSGDEGYTILPYKTCFANRSSSNYSNEVIWLNFGAPSTSTPVPGTRALSYTNTNFTDWPGWMIGSLVYFTGTPTYFTNTEKSVKIQNLIGSATESTNPLSLTFLDVDNLPTGSGKVYLGGNWNYRGTPTSPGLYYTGVIPEYNRIIITTSGNIGVSQYKFKRQKFFGYVQRILSLNNSLYRYWPQLIPALSCSGLTGAGGAQYDTDLAITEAITPTFFNVQQLSACCRYDDSSFIFVKTNKIIIYNVGAGDYWKINGSYTAIHQVAVMGGKIYIACRATGLWVVDPYNSLTPVSLAGPGSGIDLSVCNGVAKGYGNTIWAVGVNCLASYDGTTWTRYDSTTSPSFTMAGVSDGNWGNIEYIKVDEDSPDNQMLLVRKFNATVDPTILGVWWSTTTPATNTGAELAPTATQLGRPRVHRGHVAGLGGYWLVLVRSQWNRMAFGATSFTSVTNASAYVGATSSTNYVTSSPSIFCWLYQSAVLIKTVSGQILSWHSDSAQFVGWDSATSSGNIQFYMAQKTINSTGTVIDNLTTGTSGLIWYWGLFGSSNMGPSYGYSGEGWQAARTSTQSGYSGAYDMAHNFILTPGVMVTLNYDTANGPNGGQTFWRGLTVAVSNYGLDYTPTGGPMAAYTAQQEFGWDGSQWVLGAAGGKPTHTAAEPLDNGVTVRFEAGATGTSFVTPNLYKYGACYGILKDNASRISLNAIPYYFRNVVQDLTDLESSVVPTLRSGPTGVVGIDIANSSSNVSTNVNGDVIFPGQNVRQYAVGDKELIGDFILSIDVTNINAADVRNAMFIGVTRKDFWNTGWGYVGWLTSAAQLYTYDGGTTTSIAATSAATTSLEIRRVGSTLTLWRNGSIARTITSTGIRASDLVLQVVYSVWDHVDTTYLPATGTRTPRATITSNGSAVYIGMGNPSTDTGTYKQGFYGVDVLYGSGSFTLNGVAVTPKTDGTAPLPGEITIDILAGVMYFNSANIGQAVTARYTAINS